MGTCHPTSRGCRPVLGCLLAAALGSAACAPIVRPPDFAGARDRVTEATLLGPFDGQVLDETTSAPIAGATVVATWSYDHGEGLIGPAGARTVRIKTDEAGRYRVPTAPDAPSGEVVRLVSFELIVYKRGYVAYRSDAVLEGGPRHDFVQRHNRVLLRKWRDSDSHAQHLLFLSAPPEVQTLARWEQARANADLYRAQTGAAPTAGEGPGPLPDAEPTLQLLDATALLPPEEVRTRTGYTGDFATKELADLVRTHFYHGVHLQAVERTEEWDVAYRVWKDPPGGLDTVRETLEATLPDVEPSDAITDQTWVYDSPEVRAVGFLDPERKVGVLLTCGASQCVDIETAIVLTRVLRERLGLLRFQEAPAEEVTP